jgi:predicted glycosyltransferase
MRRVLVYSHDTFGLGNIRRMLAISQALTEADASVSVLILSGSPMLHAFRMPPRIDYVKLPCLARDANGIYGVKYLDLDYQAALRLRSSLIVSAAIEFAPDVVLVDKKPLGVDGELEAALDLLGASERPPSVYLILRDILDDPEVTRRIWQKHDYHRAIERHYHGVLVAGCPSVFDVAKEYAFPAATREMTEHVGYLHRPGGRKTREGVRAGFDLCGLPLLLVHAGGGGDGAPLIEAFLEGLHARQGRAPFYSWIISGPEMSEVERERLRCRASSLAHVRFEDFTDDMQSCMQAADAVVSMGGYNTVCEVLSLKKPALIVPRSRPVKEQAMRAVRMAAQGYLACMLDADINPDALIAAAMRLTMNGGAQIRARRALPFAGLDRIADIVCRQAPLRPAAPAPVMAHAKLASLA